MRKTLKKLLCTTLALSMAIGMVGCGSKETSSDGKSTQSADGSDSSVPVISDITLGEDYTDLTADIKILTHRTDIVDTTFADYIKEFNKEYPNIKVTYEGVTDYKEDITTRLTTDNWGDVCMIPDTVDKSELGDYFVPFGNEDALSENYVMLNNKSYDNVVYGIPSTGNANNIVIYNKKVFEEAGITQNPTTPDEFLEDLQLIKDKTDAIPLYTNYHSGWAMSSWDSCGTYGATGDADFSNITLLHKENPFAKEGDGQSGTYAAYYTLYEAVSRSLVEDDPTTSDWEGCKAMINNGQIGCMVLGSWAITQFQAAGDNADDITCMPFPISVDGKQYEVISPDYAYGINKNASEDNQIASMIYIKWLTEVSNFSYNEGGIPIVKGADYPDCLAPLEVATMSENTSPLEGEEDLKDTINNDSEVGFEKDETKDCELLEHALTGDMTLDEVMGEWNEAWTMAQEDNEVEITD